MSKESQSKTSSSVPTPSIPIYTRIRDADGFVGTIVYVGSVASSKNPKERYAGVVWDDSSRGKHDGSVVCRQTNQIVRHFSCGPTQGSFLKLKKLDFGVTLTAKLLRDKYVEMNAPIIAPNNILPHSAKTSSGREKTIEFLGELKIRKRQQLENIDKISLRREAISRASSDEDMAEFGHIKDIDLAGNLLCNWGEVRKIILQFPLLENFSVAHNAVRDLNEASWNVRFDRLKTLNLNNCSVQSFGTVQLVADTMPNLESLCVANSNLSDIQNHGDVRGFRNLRQLDCSRCCFDQWKNQVSKFASLPVLESLSIDDNDVPTIPPDAGIAPSFSSLLSLQISGTGMSTWLDLEAVNSFACLRALRFRNFPLTATLGEGEVRSVAIARFPKLEYLNASMISHNERVEAERRYVTLVSYSLQSADQSNPPGEDSGDDPNNEDSPQRLAILKDHPRYPELMEKHNNLATFLKNGTKNGGTLATSVYNVTIKSMAASSCTMEPIVRRLPGTMTVERMKALCSRTFDVDFDLVCLRFHTDKADSFPIEMDEDDRTLDYYGLCDGAEVLVDEVDVRARELDAKRNDEDLEKRMSELDRSIKAMQNVKIRR
mmetsp:Transcript_2947/g.8036  ORF Transcript_2947/g.8036 Transcript_2947/m.8036 type:complete len:602 (-) Transcript_2947:50-1855(-)